MRFSWTKGRGMVAVSAALMALHGAQAALAQFVPYNPGNQNQGYAQYQAQAQPQYAQPQYAQPQYTAMAFQGSATRAPSQSQPAEAIGPGQMQNGGQVMQSAPVQSYSSAPAAGCNCQPAPAMNYSQPAPAPMAYESYPSGGCASGSCSTYNTFNGGAGFGASAPYGSCGVGGGGYLGAGLGGRGCGGGRQWFGGFYGLYMERAGSDWVPLAFSTDSVTNTAPYYPAPSEYVLNLQGITETDHAGAEFRLGSTIGSARCGCGPRHAWEVAYWGLLEEDETAVFTDLAAPQRLYSNIDYRGLTYNGRPVNDYYDYGPPTVDRSAPGPDVEVRSFTARSTFSAQNIELNLLCLPVLSSGCGCASSGCGCDAGGCGVGGCASGSCGVGGGSYGYGRPRYSVTTLVGARYLRLDEDFYHRTDFEVDPGGAATAGFLANNVEADNHLVGVQLGCNGIYRLGCSGRWAITCNANAGIYNNHAEVTQFFDVPVGGPPVDYVSGGNFGGQREEDSVATVAELRAGTSYQYSCNWRFFGGYRALGISGVALSFDQMPGDYSSATQVNYVDTNGSIFLHGLQGGVEFTY